MTPIAVYDFGLDPIWHGTSSQLAYTNSLKMKIAVSLGVVQMTFGIILSAFNHVYFDDYLSIYTEFVPQMLFMMSLFGYMILMVRSSLVLSCKFLLRLIYIDSFFLLSSFLRLCVPLFLS